MDYGMLGAFATVYECGGINKAAKELFMSPQVSRNGAALVSADF